MMMELIGCDDDCDDDLLAGVVELLGEAADEVQGDM